MGTSLANMVDAICASLSPPLSKLFEQLRELASSGDFMNALTSTINAYLS
jgi:hypothetical protein